jgi:hypothetical protein
MSQPWQPVRGSARPSRSPELIPVGAPSPSRGGAPRIWARRRPSCGGSFRPGAGLRVAQGQRDVLVCLWRTACPAATPLDFSCGESFAFAAMPIEPLAVASARPTTALSLE